MERRGEYLTVWRKQRDGSWKVIFDTGSTLPPSDDVECQVPHEAPGVCLASRSPDRHPARLALLVARA